MIKRADFESYRRRHEAEGEAMVQKQDFSETQEIRETLIKDGHSELVVKSITASIQRLEGRIVWLESELAKKVSDTGAWSFVSVRLMSRRDRLIARVAWGLGIPGALALLGLLGHYAWKGMHAQ